MPSLPTLSPDGWVNTPQQKLQKLFSYFIHSEYDRTFFFKNKLTSFKYIISNYGRDDEIISALTSQLTSYLLTYFTSVTVTVKKVKTTEHFSYAFAVSVIDNDIPYRLNSDIGEDISPLDEITYIINRKNDG